MSRECPGPVDGENVGVICHASAYAHLFKQSNHAACRSRGVEALNRLFFLGF